MMFLRKTRDLRTFSKRVETRYISLSTKMEWNPDIKNYFLKITKRINENLDIIIQSLIMKIPDRQIPFVKIVLGEEVSNNKLRLLVADCKDSIDEPLPQFINIDDLSHLIKLRITPGQKQIILGQIKSLLNAEMLIDEEYIVCAATDIFLDIAMFNSYSFLRQLSDKEKKTFSSSKYKYFVENECKCYYHYKEFLVSEPLYFSLAFAARKSKTEIDLDEYIYIWDEFLSKKYPNQSDNTESIIQQLKYHKSFGQITKNDPNYNRTINWFDEEGSKLILRINMKPKEKKKRNEVATYFGIPKFHLGTIKIVDLKEYYNPKLSYYLECGYVSAFKVIVNKDNIGK